MHFNLSFGQKDEDKCAECGSDAVLVTFPCQVETHPEDHTAEQEVHEINEEVSGHYCEKCRKMIAIFVNT